MTDPSDVLKMHDLLLVDQLAEALRLQEGFDEDSHSMRAVAALRHLRNQVAHGDPRAALTEEAQKTVDDVRMLLVHLNKSSLGVDSVRRARQYATPKDIGEIITRVSTQSDPRKPSNSVAETVEPTPAEHLSARLRALREDARLTFRELSRRAHYSPAALGRASNSRTLPTWRLVEAFVGACGGDLEEFRELWEAAAQSRTEAARPGEAHAITEDHRTTAARGPDEEVGAQSTATAESEDYSSLGAAPAVAAHGTPVSTHGRSASRLASARATQLNDVRISSFCHASDNALGVAMLADSIEVVSTDRGDGGLDGGLRFSREQWKAFVAGVKAGEFDLD